MELKGKHILVAGLGKSGIGAAKLLLKKGAEVTLYDGNESMTYDRVKDHFPGYTLPLVAGELTNEAIASHEILVLSPGISVEAPFVEKAKAAGLLIWGEIELAYVCSKGRLAAVTGTNGKTTTVSLIGEIFKNYFESAFVVGNIGIPYTGVADQMGEESVTVAEISSFQLETIHEFHPEVSAVLNITPDHLNRHHTMENYATCKMKIAMNQTYEEICVLNHEDEYLPKLAKTLTCKPFFFSSKQVLEEGIYYQDGGIYLAVDGQRERLMDVSQMQLVGMHNVENVMAAIAVTYFMRVPMDVILQTVYSFQAVEHRIEFVKEVNGVKYYNDSKGTNTDASMKAIEAMPSKTVLIAGGYDKGSKYDEWVDAFKDTIKDLVLLGVTKDKIRACAEKKGFHNIHMVESLEEAVKLSSQLAKPGENVLLSPACASWDMFQSYEQRGDLFKEYVRNL